MVFDIIHLVPPPYYSLLIISITKPTTSMKLTNNDSKKLPFKKSTIFLVTILAIGGLSLSFFKTSTPLVKELNETTLTKGKTSVEHEARVQYTDMTADNWELRVPDCLLGSAPPDNPEMTEVYLSIHAPEEIQNIVYEEIAINKLKENKYIVPPLGYFKRCFSSDNFRYNMDHENFASFLDFICVARYSTYLNKKKSTNTKLAYDQYVNMVIHETRSGRIVHRPKAEIKTAYFPKNTSKKDITTGLHEELKKGLSKVKIPKLIDPEIVEDKAKSQ